MDEEYNTYLCEDKVVVIEPILKTRRIKEFVKSSAVALLKAHEYKLESITTVDYFVIIKLLDNSLVVNAINLLKNMSGISFIFVGIPVKLKYDTIISTVSTIYSNMMIVGEKYFLLVKSLINFKLNTQESILQRFDVEFSIQSELSSTSKKLIRVENIRDADRIIYLLLTPDTCYVSLLLFKGQDNIPFNYLQETILCPIFDNISMISFISVLNAGYTATPFFFYIDKQHAQKLLKTFEKLITKSSLMQIRIYMLSIQEHIPDYIQHMFVTENDIINMDTETKIFHWLNLQIIISKMLEKLNLDNKMIGLPVTPFVHPPWFIKEISNIIKESDKIVMTPLLFNYSNQQFKADISEFFKLDLNFNFDLNQVGQTADFDQGKFKEILRTCPIIFDNLTPKYANFTLRVGKDDILDILNSI
ncbi:MAG TPA: hypothetical protein VD815_02225 [Candidatus Saccharimonadales bacterium]|nr:hypothetical protein [Candidatus Saccharimonadales bacterium]